MGGEAILLTGCAVAGLAALAGWAADWLARRRSAAWIQRAREAQRK